MRLDQRTGSLVTLLLLLGLGCSWPLHDEAIIQHDLRGEGDLPLAEGRMNVKNEDSVSQFSENDSWTGEDGQVSDEGLEEDSSSRLARGRPYVPFNSLTMSANSNAANFDWISSNMSDIRQKIDGSKLGGKRPISRPSTTVPLPITTKGPNATVIRSTTTLPIVSTSASYSEGNKLITQSYISIQDIPETTTPRATTQSSTAPISSDEWPTVMLPTSGLVNTTVNEPDTITEASMFSPEHNTSEKLSLSTVVPTSVTFSSSGSPFSVTRFPSNKRPPIKIVSSTTRPPLTTELPLVIWSPPVKGPLLTTRPSSITRPSSPTRLPPTTKFTLTTWFPSITSFTSTKTPPSSTRLSQTTKPTPTIRPPQTTRSPPSTGTPPTIKFPPLISSSQSITTAPPSTNPTSLYPINTDRPITQSPKNSLVNASNILTFGFLSTWQPTYRPNVTTLQDEEKTTPTFTDPQVAYNISRRPTSSRSTDWISVTTPLPRAPAPFTSPITTTTILSKNESPISSTSVTQAPSTSTPATLPNYTPAEAAPHPGATQHDYTTSTTRPRPLENRPGRPTFSQGHPHTITDEYQHTVVNSQDKDEKFGPTAPNRDEISWSSPRPISTIVMPESDHQLIQEAFEEFTKQYDPAIQQQTTNRKPDLKLPMTEETISDNLPERQPPTTTTETEVFNSNTQSEQSDKITLVSDHEDTSQSILGFTSPSVTTAGAGPGESPERLPHHRPHTTTPAVWTTLSTTSRSTLPEASTDSNLTRLPTVTPHPEISPVPDDKHQVETVPTTSLPLSQEGNDVTDFEYDFYEDNLSEYYAAYGNIWDKHEEEMDGGGPHTLGLPPPQSPNLHILAWPYTIASASTPHTDPPSSSWTPASHNGNFASQSSDSNVDFHPQVSDHIHSENSQEIKPFLSPTTPSSADDMNFLHSPVPTAPPPSTDSFLNYDDYEYQSVQHNSQSLADSSIDLNDYYDALYSNYDEVYYYIERRPPFPASPTESSQPSHLPHDSHAPSTHPANKTSSLYVSDESNAGNNVNQTKYDVDSSSLTDYKVPLIDLSQVQITSRPNNNPHNLNLHNPGFLDMNYSRVEGTTSSTTRPPPVLYSPAVDKGGVLGRPGSHGQGANLLQGQLNMFTPLNPLRPHQSSYNSYTHARPAPNGKSTKQANLVKFGSVTDPDISVSYLDDSHMSLAGDHYTIVDQPTATLYQQSIANVGSLRDKNIPQNKNTDKPLSYSGGPFLEGVPVGENEANVFHQDSSAYSAASDKPTVTHLQSLFPNLPGISASQYSLLAALLAEDDVRLSDNDGEPTTILQNPDTHNNHANNLHLSSSNITQQNLIKYENVTQNYDRFGALHRLVYHKVNNSFLEGTVREPDASPAQHMLGGLLRPYVRPAGPAPALGLSNVNSTHNTSLPSLLAVWDDLKLYDRPPSSLTLGWDPSQHNPKPSSLTVDQDTMGSSNRPSPSLTVTAILMPLHATQTLKLDQSHVTSTPLTRSSLPSFAVPDEITHLTSDTTHPQHKSDNTSVQFAGLGGNQHQQELKSPFNHQDLHPHRHGHNSFVLVKIWGMVGGQLALMGEKPVPISLFRNSNLTNGAVVSTQDMPADALALVASSMGNDLYLDPSLHHPGRARRSLPQDQAGADPSPSSGRDEPPSGTGQFHYDDDDVTSTSSSPTGDSRPPDNVAIFHNLPDASPMQPEHTPGAGDTTNIKNLSNSSDINTFQSNHSGLQPTKTHEDTRLLQSSLSDQHSHTFSMHNSSVSSRPHQLLRERSNSPDHSQHSRYNLKSLTESLGSVSLQQPSTGKTVRLLEPFVEEEEPPVIHFIAPQAAGQGNFGLHHSANNRKEAKKNQSSFLSQYKLDEDLNLFQTKGTDRTPARPGNGNLSKGLPPLLDPVAGGDGGSAIGGVGSHYLPVREPSSPEEVSPTHDDQSANLLLLTRQHYGGVGNPTHNNLPLSIGTTLEENDLTYLQVLTNLANRIDYSQNPNPTVEAFINRIQSAPDLQFSSGVGAIGYNTGVPTPGGALGSTFGNDNVESVPQPSVPEGHRGSILELLPQDLPHVNPLLLLNEPVDHPVDLRRVLATLPSPSRLHREQLQSRLAAITGTNTFSGHLGNQGLINRNSHAAQNSISGNYGKQPTLSQLVPRRSSIGPGNLTILSQQSHHQPPANSDKHPSTYSAHLAEDPSIYPVPSRYDPGQAAGPGNILRPNSINVSSYPRRLLTAHMYYPSSSPIHNLNYPHPPSINLENYPHLPSINLENYPHPPSINLENYPHPPSINLENYPHPPSINLENYPHPPSISLENYPHPPSVNPENYPHPPSINLENYPHPPSVNLENYLHPPSTNYPRPPSINQENNPLPPSTNQDNYPHPPSASQGIYPRPLSINQEKYPNPSMTNQENYAYQPSTNHETYPRPPLTNHETYPLPSWPNQEAQPLSPWNNQGNYPHLPWTNQANYPHRPALTHSIFSRPPSTSQTGAFPDPSDLPLLPSTSLSHGSAGRPSFPPSPPRPSASNHQANNYYELLESPTLPLQQPAISDDLTTFSPSHPYRPALNTSVFWSALVNDEPVISPLSVPTTVSPPLATTLTNMTVQDCLSDGLCSLGVAALLALTISNAFSLPFLAPFLGRRRRRRLHQHLSSSINNPDQLVPDEMQTSKLLTDFYKSGNGTGTYPEDAFTVASSFILYITRITSDANVSQETDWNTIKEKIGKLENILKALSTEQLVYIMKRSLRILLRGNPAGAFPRKGGHPMSFITEGFQAKYEGARALGKAKEDSKPTDVAEDSARGTHGPAKEPSKMSISASKNFQEKMGLK